MLKLDLKLIDKANPLFWIGLHDRDFEGEWDWTDLSFSENIIPIQGTNYPEERDCVTLRVRPDRYFEQHNCETEF